jgi:hypothetical protein
MKPAITPHKHTHVRQVSQVPADNRVPLGWQRRMPQKGKAKEASVCDYVYAGETTMQSIIDTNPIHPSNA